MKTNLFFLLVIVLLSSITLSAQQVNRTSIPGIPIVTDLNSGVQRADVSIIDIDGDGDLDIVISGQDADSNLLRVLKNNGTGTFSADPSFPFRPITVTSFDWNDINHDGKLDLISCGFSGPNIPFDSVYTSNGMGTFTKATTIALPQTAPASGFADLNNDGYTDIYEFGNKDFGHPKIFLNNKMGGFTESDQFDAYNFVDANVTAIDYDNDKDIDLFVSGYEDVSGTRFSKMFVNNGSGIFTVQDLGLIQKGYGSAVWGDFDGNGYLDLLLNGDGGLSSGENRDDIYRLYKNNAGVFTVDTTFQPYRQGSVGNGSRFLDWDNDGDLDLIVTGWTGTRQATAIYLNNGGMFTEDPNNAILPGVSESSIEVGDVDNDGDLDLVITGFSNNDFDGAGTTGPYNRNVSLLITNPATNLGHTNLPPTSPTNLHVSGTQSAITFGWDSATDATTPKKSLSYNMFLVDDQGHTFIFSLADTSTGRLTLPKLGNVQLNTGWVIHNLPAGNYRWGVQAIDNSFASSPFAKGTFTVNSNGTLPVILTLYNVVAESNRAKIEWTTGVEQNNDRFEIYRSSNGKDFTKLESIKAKGTGTNQYIIYDNNPSSGVNYYRLLQYDANGQMKDQGIKTVTFKTSDKVTVITFPNPAYSEIGIRLNNYKGRELNVTMSDMMGKLIHKESIAVNNSQGYYTLHLKSKPLTGQYILSVSGENLKENLQVLVK